MGFSLLNGDKFSKALGMGAIGLGIGAAAGSLAGGLGNGIMASRDGREFWNGARLIKEEVIADRNLPPTQSDGAYNCGPAMGEAITGIPQGEYRSALGGNPNTDPVMTNEMNDAIEHLSGRRVFPYRRPKGELGAINLAERMNRGEDFYVVSGTGTSVSHASGLNSISLKTYLRVSGSTYVKPIYQIMDPAIGGYRPMGAQSMKNIYRIIPLSK